MKPDSPVKVSEEQLRKDLDLVTEALAHNFTTFVEDPEFADK